MDVVVPVGMWFCVGCLSCYLRVGVSSAIGELERWVTEGGEGWRSISDVGAAPRGVLDNFLAAFPWELYGSGESLSWNALLG